MVWAVCSVVIVVIEVACVIVAYRSAKNNGMARGRRLLACGLVGLAVNVAYILIVPDFSVMSETLISIRFSARGSHNGQQPLWTLMVFVPMLMLAFATIEMLKKKVHSNWNWIILAVFIALSIVLIGLLALKVGWTPQS